MEERKLIRLGNSSFAISLPKEWIDKSNLKKGDKVFLVPNSNGEIIVSPEFKKPGQDKRITINLDGKDETKIKREFTSAYINGNSIFEFIGNTNKEKSRQIKKIVREYISCEVTEESENSIIAKDFFNFEEMNMNNFIRRMDNNLKEMFEIIIKGLEKKEITASEVNEMDSIDLDINKFYFLNSRIMIMGLNNQTLINKLKIEPTDLFNNWWLAFHLEHTGDNLKAIAKKIKSEDINQETKKLLLTILSLIKEKYEDSLETFYSGDKELAYKIMEKSKKNWELCENLTKSKNAFLSLVGEKLKNIENASYQIVKMISHLK